MKFRKKPVVIEAFQWFDDWKCSRMEPMAECMGNGMIRCRCGGDICVCGMDELDCPGCERCEEEPEICEVCRHEYCESWCPLEAARCRDMNP